MTLSPHLPEDSVPEQHSSSSSILLFLFFFFLRGEMGSVGSDTCCLGLLSGSRQPSPSWPPLPAASFPTRDTEPSRASFFFFLGGLETSWFPFASGEQELPSAPCCCF